MSDNVCQDCQELGHKFEPRYNEVWPDGMESASIQSIHFDGTTNEGSQYTIAACKNKIYIHDICVRCGEIVKEKK